MMPEKRKLSILGRPWWDTRVDPPSNRRDSFKAVANKRSKQKRRKKK